MKKSYEWCLKIDEKGVRNQSNDRLRVIEPRRQLRVQLMTVLPKPITELVDVLAAMPGTVAVVLGGSRALRSDDQQSDWDLGVYYRGEIDLAALSALGTVFPPGSWGRVMNGGAWLECGEEKVDVILRDLNVVEYWTSRAQQGEFERDALLGYLAGIPTYTLTAELASCLPLSGSIEAVPFPSKLAAAAPQVWRFCRSFSLDYARMYARRGNVAGVAGQVAAAVIEEAHAISCERSEWVCNEKRLLETAGLSSLNDLFAEIPNERLLEWVDLVADQLGVQRNEAMPWKR